MSVTADVRTSKTYTLDQAFEYCSEITTSHYENFPVASLFLPEEKRQYVQSIYAFSRIADDFADEGVRPPSERLDDISAWEQQLLDCYNGKAHHPVFIALTETVTRLDIPVEPLRDLLSAFKQDVAVRRYRTFDDLLDYCRRSANPVGRLVLMIYGVRSEELFRLSDDICTALQLANFWQDVAVDVQKDRVYIPLEDIDRYGYSLDRLQKGIIDEEYRSLMKFEVERTMSLFYSGATLPAGVERGLQLELKLVWFGGMRILHKIRRAKYNVFKDRPRLGAWDKCSILASGLLIDDLSRFGRKNDAWESE